MSAGDQHQSVDVDGAPESWFHPDLAILEQIDKWSVLCSREMLQRQSRDAPTDPSKRR